MYNFMAETKISWNYLTLSNHLTRRATGLQKLRVVVKGYLHDVETQDLWWRNKRKYVSSAILSMRLTCPVLVNGEVYNNDIPFWLSIIKTGKSYYVVYGMYFPV